jgi:hypothetical protein
METGLAKLRALEVIGLSADALADIRWRNAARLFPDGAFPLAADALKARPAPRVSRPGATR